MIENHEPMSPEVRDRLAPVIDMLRDLSDLRDFTITGYAHSKISLTAPMCTGVMSFLERPAKREALKSARTILEEVLYDLEDAVHNIELALDELRERHGDE